MSICVVFIRKHASPPHDLFLDFGRNINGHHKLALTFTGEVMDGKIVLFEKSSFM